MFVVHIKKKKKKNQHWKNSYFDSYLNFAYFQQSYSVFMKKYQLKGKFIFQQLGTNNHKFRQLSMK